MKKSKCVLLGMMLLASLTACASKEAKNVMEQIDNIGTVSLSSESALENLQAEYEKLSESDKADVTNYEELESANSELHRLQADDFDLRVEKAVKNVTSDSRDQLSALVEEYNHFSSETVGFITSYDKISEAQRKCNELLAEEVVSQVDELANGHSDEAWNLIVENKDILSENQMRRCLAVYGRWASYSTAEEAIKETLKSPRSFYCYKASSWPSGGEDGEYLVIWTIDYGATNSFGGEVRSTVYQSVKFTIDVDTPSITYKAIT